MFPASSIPNPLKHINRDTVYTVASWTQARRPSTNRQLGSVAAPGRAAMLAGPGCIRRQGRQRGPITVDAAKLVDSSEDLACCKIFALRFSCIRGCGHARRRGKWRHTEGLRCYRYRCRSRSFACIGDRQSLVTPSGPLSGLEGAVMIW